MNSTQVSHTGQGVMAGSYDRVVDGVFRFLEDALTALR